MGHPRISADRKSTHKGNWIPIKVQVDETFFFHRKYHRQVATLLANGFLEGWEENPMVVVSQFSCRRDTLEAIITDHIAPGSHILSDAWAAYHALDQIQGDACMIKPAKVTFWVSWGRFANHFWSASKVDLSVTSDWTFIPVTCYSSKEQSLSLCDECSRFVCQPADLGSTLAFIKAKKVGSCEDLSEYETLVREFNFRATSNVHLKPWGEKSTHHHDPHRVSLYIGHQIQSDTAEKVIFWNSHQLKALLSNPKVMVIANTTFGGGKTEVLKAKAMEVAERHPEDEVIFIVYYRWVYSNLETLLTMRLREDFAQLQKLKNVRVMQMDDDEDIASQIPETPSSRTHLFIDEVKEGIEIRKWMENHNLLDPEIRNREDTPYLWVVAMNDWSQRLELPEDMIERGLGVNMRYGEEVQRMAKAFYRNSCHVSREWSNDYLTKCIQHVNAHMKVAGGFALILLQDLNDDKKRIETFVRDSGSGNPPQKGQSSILVTTLDLAEGFECNTVFVEASTLGEPSVLHRGVLHLISLNPDLRSIPWEVRKVLFPKDPFLSQDERINQLLFPKIGDKNAWMPFGLDGEAQTAHFYDIVDQVEEDHPGWRDRLDPEQTHWFLIDPMRSWNPHDALVKKLKAELNALVYLEHPKERIETFVRDSGSGNPPQEGQSSILVTTLDLAEGFECNTVFAETSSSREPSMLLRGVLHHISLNPDLSSIPWEVRKVLFPKDPFLSQDESINQLLFPRIGDKKTWMPLGLDGEAQTAHFYDLVDKVEEDHPSWRDRLAPEQTHWFFIDPSCYPDSCLGAKIVLQDGTSFFVIPFYWYDSDNGRGIVPKSTNSRHKCAIEASNYHLPFVIVEIIRLNGQIDDLRFDLARIERIRHRMLKEFRSQKRLPDNLDLTPQDWKGFYLEQVKALQEKPKDAADFLSFVNLRGEDYEWISLMEAVGCFLFKDLTSWRNDLQNDIETAGNGLIMNVSKTQLMLGGKVRCADLEDFHVVVDGVTVFPDKKLELLGVKFDSSFSTFPHGLAHGASVSASARQRAAMIARLSHHLPRGAYLQQLARGLVLGK
eukprot:maker-scaffold1409_size42848-snap-gene-0.6 protein:Tk05513 transcript:maker-scaffold1409_size42848-snap-gene-0.6-mRNA-1 annotation:"uncharacterized transposase-like protein"